MFHMPSWAYFVQMRTTVYRVVDVRLFLGQVHVLLDVLDGPVGAGRHGLHRGAGEPEDHGPAAHEAEQHRGVRQAQGQKPRLAQQQDDRENHRRGADHGRADQHRLGRRLEGVAGRVVGFQVVLADLEVGVEAEVAADLFLDAGNLLGLGQLEDRLGVVGHGAVAVHGDVDRPHAQEAERHQAEGEDGADADGRLAPHQLHHHQVVEAQQTDEVGARHQGQR